MTTPSYTHARIAYAGLDLLHMTRLRVACSLLMSDRLEAELHPWPAAGVRVLVAGMDDAAGLVAIDAGARSGVAIVRIARTPGHAPGILQHGATVRELFDQLRAILIEEALPSGNTPIAPSGGGRLLDMASGADGDVAVLALQGMRVAVDRSCGTLYPAHGVGAAALAASATQTGWRVDWRTRQAFDVDRANFAAAKPLESVVWQIAVTARSPVGDFPRMRRIGLSAWPDVETGVLPDVWLLPMSCLLQRAWSCVALAQACGLPVVEIERIFAAMHHSGLASTATVGVSGRAEDVPVPAAERGFLTRVARRFGLHFGGNRG